MPARVVRIVRIVRSFAAVAATAIVATSALAFETAFRAGEFDPPRPAPEFHLAGSDGKELTLERFRGKVVVVEFGFTACPAICPTTLAVLAKARRELGDDAQKMQVVYITVDPERDTAGHLAEYLAKFDPTFVGGTGTEEQLAAVRKSYGVEAARIEGAGGYVHSSSVYLVDPDGKLRLLMPFGQSSGDYVHDVRRLLGRAA